MAEQPVSCAEPAEQRATGDDRRAAERFPSTREAVCQPAHGDSTDCWRARIRDVSAFGIGLVLPEKLEPGAVLNVEVDQPQSSTPRRVLARIVHITPVGPSEWLAGCAFVDELDDATLNIYQGARLRPSGNDCRAWVRFPCNVETFCYSCYTAPGERVPARILNISAGGVGLLTPCEFDKGTLLKLALPGPAGQPRRSLVRIQHVIYLHNGDWFLGCEFAGQLDDEELQEWV